MSSPPFISFVHIAKAGGMTMHALLHSCFRGYVCLQPHLRFGATFTKDDLRLLRLLLPWRVDGIGGHRVRAYADYGSVVEGSVFNLTFIRDPIRRYLSHLNWQITQMHIDWSIESFTDDDTKNNIYAQWICGEANNWPKARQALDELFDFIGLLECFDESLVLLRQRLGMPTMDIRYERTNTTRAKDTRYCFEDLSTAMKEKVYANNAIDMKIFEYVRDVLMPRYRAEYGPALVADTEAFRVANQSYRFPTHVWLKWRVTNALMHLIVQPMILARSRRGHP